MPARIRTDNGAPFAGTGLLGLSKLSLGWMKLGIVQPLDEGIDRYFGLVGVPAAPCATGTVSQEAPVERNPSSV
jgi:hypothetical protein